MKKVCVIGHFGDGKKLLNGQTIKTKIIADELLHQFGEENILTLDTHGGIKAYLKLPLRMITALKRCKNVVILPAHNGVKVIVPMLYFLNRLFKRKLHYVVIGGWLPGLVRSNKCLGRKLKRFSGIYVETNTIRNSLEKQGFLNIVVMPNCKKLRIIDDEELSFPSVEPFKLCTFSRVMKEKGIEDIISAIVGINGQNKRVIYSLDIYGPVDQDYKERFEKIIKNAPKYIRYCGSVDYDQSTAILKKYFALVFPTQYYTEGIPGTIIDGYAAGLPVVSARWESYNDIVKEGVTGVGYEFMNCSDLENILYGIKGNPNQINNMRKSCLKAAKRYSTDEALKILIHKFG